MTESTASASTALTPIQRVGAMLESDAMKAKLRASLDGLGISPERFARAALGALAQNNFVAERCTVPSIVTSVMQAASLGLELDPRLGQAYLVPRGNSATLQIGVRGWLQMAYNTGKLLSLDLGEVCERDKVVYRRGTDPQLIVEPPFGDRGDVVAYYCVAQWAGGGVTIETMTKDEVIAHRDRFSDAWKRQGAKSPWGTDFDEMAKKTVLSRARKKWPVSLVPAGAEIDGDGYLDQRPEPVQVQATAPSGTVYDASTGEVIEETASAQPTAQVGRPTRLAQFSASARQAAAAAQ